MADNRPLYKYVGDPVVLIRPSTLSSDGTGTTVTGAAGIGIAGYDGILFQLILGATDANYAASVQLQYSSTGAGSDAATSNAGMTCTDAIYTATDLGASADQVYLLDFSIAAKGLSDRAGKIFANIAAAETGATQATLIGIPYGGTRLYPATNAQTVVVADA